jgi:hypothetical protein
MAVCCRKMPLAETTWPPKYRRKGQDRWAQNEIPALIAFGDLDARAPFRERKTEFEPATSHWHGGFIHRPRQTQFSDVPFRLRLVHQIRLNSPL